MKAPSRKRLMLAGPVGSGKSSELYQILRSMAQSTDYETRLFDLGAHVDVRSLSAGQVLFLVALTVLKSADLALDEHRPILQRLEQTYLAVTDEAAGATFDIGPLLERVSAITASIALGPVGAAAASLAGALASGLSTRLSLPGSGRRLLPNDPGARELVESLSEVVQLARKKTGRRFLVLVDGLDKVDEEQITELFCSGVLSCRDVSGLDLVFTAPPSLRFQIGYGGGVGFETLRLGLFNVLHRDGTHRGEEVDAMRRVVERRISSAGFQPLELMPYLRDDDGPLTEAILQSGGLVRDLVRVVRRSLVKAADDTDDLTVRPEHLRTAMTRIRKEYLDRLTLEREELLWRTWQERQRPDRPMADKLLNDNLILTYENGDPWCSPHPMVMNRLRSRFERGNA